MENGGALERMKRYPFLRNILGYAPEEAGVYVLWDAYDVLFIGRAGNIREALVTHLDRKHGACTARASHYSWEISLWAAARETELLAEHSRGRGGLDPRCQDVA